MALHIVAEANRCLNCKNPRCQQGCPVHTPIPMIIQMFKEGKLMEAGQKLFENNPMSAVCAIVAIMRNSARAAAFAESRTPPFIFQALSSISPICILTA